MDSAGKTGTTNNYVDRWYCGFTPYYTGATWYGYDENEKNHMLVIIHQETYGEK